MNRSWRHGDVVALAATLVLPLGMAAILVPFRSSFANTASALVLVAVIVAVAVTGNRCGSDEKIFYRRLAVLIAGARNPRRAVQSSRQQACAPGPKTVDSFRLATDDSRIAV